MNRTLMTRMSASTLSQLVNATAAALACVAMLSLTHCAAPTVDEETGAAEQALLVSQTGSGFTCAAGDGCKEDCSVHDVDCGSQGNTSQGNSSQNNNTSPKTTWSLTGAVSHTDISGYSGSLYTMGNPNSDSHGVYALLSNERSDEPCYVSLGTEDLNDANLDVVSTLDMCGPKSYSNSSVFLHADLLDVNAGGDDDHTFVNGVIVCMNHDRTKVKGIAVTGAKLTSDGKIISLLDAQADTRPNCDGRWESWQYCLSGQVATAVDFHFAAGDTPRDLTGIALQCRTLAR